MKQTTGGRKTILAILWDLLRHSQSRVQVPTPGLLTPLTHSATGSSMTVVERVCLG